MEPTDDKTLLARLISILGADKFRQCEIYIEFISEIEKLPYTHKGFKVADLHKKLGDEGFDFLCQLMEPDPLLRIEAVEALNHCWLTNDD